MKVEEIKSGDVVTLKSGGPNMTISFEDESVRRCTCQWFEGKNLLEAFFDKTALIKVEGK